MNKLFSLSAAALFSVAVSAQNLIVQTYFTGDPAPMVTANRFYVYTGHDEDNADFFWMYEWRVYSSADMVNWLDHGSPLNIAPSVYIDNDGQTYICWGNPTILMARLNDDMISHSCHPALRHPRHLPRVPRSLRSETLQP